MRWAGGGRGDQASREQPSLPASGVPAGTRGQGTSEGCLGCLLRTEELSERAVLLAGCACAVLASVAA